MVSPERSNNDPLAKSYSMYPSTAPAHAPQRRARVACQACNARRVRCDVADVHPCWHCRVRKTSCVLIESRRGKYERKKRTPRPEGSASSPLAHGDPSLASSLTSNTTSLSTSVDCCLPVQDSAAVTVVEWRDDIAAREGVTAEMSREDDETYHATRSEGPEMLYARLAEDEPITPHRSSQIKPQGRSYYLGESFSLAYIVRTMCGTTKDGTVASPYRLHYPIPPSVSDRPTGSVSWNELCSGNIPGLQIDLSTTPSRPVADKLIRVFFETTHPAWPVFDRREFTCLYKQGQVSLLVLQTIFFLALTVCDNDLVQDTGFADRAEARKVYYLRAKALYDADYETDRSNLAAVLLLLGFWWAGPEDQKDTWHWLGCAISLAQTLGMHRSTAQSGMTRQHQSRWKRIWWSIYIRDRHAAAALGRPCRIRDEDCDVDLLTADDFYVDDGYDEQLIPAQESFHIQYTIEMSKLAMILGRILSGEYSPRRSTAITPDTQQLGGELTEWESQLPSELHQTPLDATLGPAFWARMLYANYQPSLVEPLSSADIDKDHKARMAADYTTRIVEDLLAAHNLRYGQLHLVPAIFAALSILAVVIRRKDPILRQLAENRSRQCMLALSELSKLWPVGGWILQLFITLMTRLTGPIRASKSPSSVTRCKASDKTRQYTARPSKKANGVNKTANVPKISPGYENERSAMPTPPHNLDTQDWNMHSPRPSFLATQEQHQFSYHPLEAGQLLCDALWAGTMDAGFPMDILLHDNSAPFLSSTFGGVSMVEDSCSEAQPRQDLYMG